MKPKPPTPEPEPEPKLVRVRLLRDYHGHPAGTVVKVPPSLWQTLRQVGDAEAVPTTRRVVHPPKPRKEPVQPAAEPLPLPQPQPKRKQGGAGRGRGVLTDELVRILKGMAAKGLTDAEMAQIIGVIPDTINSWRKKNPKIDLDLRIAKDAADRNVESALYKRACGFSHPDVHITSHLGMVTLTPITKVYPPDPTSCIFWLKNRQPDRWRDRQEITGKDGAPVSTNSFNPDSLTVEELLVLQQMLAKGDQPKNDK